jgi:hypothetical protein
LSALAGLILSASGALAADMVNDVTGLNPVPVARERYDTAPACAAATGR